MGKIIGYVQFESESEKILQRAAIDKFVKDKFGTNDIKYVFDNIQSYISWKSRVLGKEMLPSLEKDDTIVVSESKRLGNSSPEIDLFLMYVTEKGVDVYEARLNTKISGN